MFETLESRQMFSATLAATAVRGPALTPGDGVVVPGTPSKGEEVVPRDTTRLVGTTLYVTGTDRGDILEVFPQGFNVVARRNGGDAVAFAASAVKKVVLLGYEANDHLLVDPTLTVVANAYGGVGNDLITGGVGGDLLDGGPGDDTIEGAGGADNILGRDGNDKLFGQGGADDVRGDAGDDTIDGGSGDDVLFGLAGNDTIFCGLGADTAHGNDGDDTLVSVFGGVDDVSGDAGWDIFMADKSDVIHDADQLAVQRKSIYKIDKFANPTKGSTFATELGDVDIVDPAVSFPATKHADLSFVPLFTAKGPQMGDVQQDQLADCWLTTAAASIAGTDPGTIKRAVMPLGDGTFAVALGSKVYRIDGDLAVKANGGQAYASAFGRDGSSLWFPLLEKAMAYHLGSSTSPKYADVANDTPGTAFNALRVSYDKHLLVGTGATRLWDRIRANPTKPKVITTEPSTAGVNSKLVHSHAYSVLGTINGANNNTRMVILRNPSDMNGRDADAKGIVVVSVAALYDSCLLFYVGDLATSVA